MANAALLILTAEAAAFYSSAASTLLTTVKAVQFWPWRKEDPTNPLWPLKAPGDVRSDGAVVITLHTMHGNEPLLTL